jgi:hypothetical protein
MNEVERSAQRKVARLAKRKRIVYQPHTVAQREYGLRPTCLTRDSREAGGSV